MSPDCIKEDSRTRTREETYEDSNVNCRYVKLKEKVNVTFKKFTSLESKVDKRETDHVRTRVIYKQIYIGTF